MQSDIANNLAGQILKALSALKNMPSYLIAEGKEIEYRQAVLESCNITESELTSFIKTHQPYGICLKDHSQDLESLAHDYREDFQEKFNKSLSICFNDEDRLKCLHKNNCHYLEQAHEVDMWQRHLLKSFDEFAQWHIEQGGWQADFQGLKLDRFAYAWASNWMSNWLCGLIVEMQDRVESRSLLEKNDLINNREDRTISSSLTQSSTDVNKSVTVAQNEGVAWLDGIDFVTDNGQHERLLRELNQWRETYFLEKKAVKRVTFGHDDDPRAIIFIVKPFSNLVADLHRRLSRSIRKKELVENELAQVSYAINEEFCIGFSVSGFRHAIDSKQIDLSLFEDVTFESGMQMLAQYWDIIHYESFLKDKIALSDTHTASEKTNYSEPSQVGDEHPIPVLYTTPDSRQSLYHALTAYVDKSQHIDLSDLIIDNKTPSKKIRITGLQKDFGLQFHWTNAVPTNGAKALSEQLPNYFVINRQGVDEPLTSSTLVKHLRGKVG